MSRKTTTTRKPAAGKRKLPVAKKMDAARAIAFAKSSAKKMIDAGVEAAGNARKSAIAQFRKTRKVAINTANEAREVAVSRAEEAKARTVEAVTHLEKVFEQRVSRAISRLGVPTTKDVRALSRQVTQLQASVESLRRSRARAA